MMRWPLTSPQDLIVKPTTNSIPGFSEAGASLGKEGRGLIYYYCWYWFLFIFYEPTGVRVSSYRQKTLKTNC